jgi:hypothetical protein
MRRVLLARRGAHARRLDDLVDRVHLEEAVRVVRHAAVVGIERQVQGVDRRVDLGRVERRDLVVRDERAARGTRRLGRREAVGPHDVVEHAGRLGRSARHHRHRGGERVGGARRRGVRVLHAALDDPGQRGGGLRGDVRVEVELVKAVDADEHHVVGLAAAVTVFAAPSTVAVQRGRRGGDGVGGRGGAGGNERQTREQDPLTKHVCFLQSGERGLVRPTACAARRLRG